MSCIHHQTSININILPTLFHRPHCFSFSSPPVIPLNMKPDQVLLMLTTFPRLSNSEKVGEALTLSMAHISYVIFHRCLLHHLTTVLLTLFQTLAPMLLKQSLVCFCIRNLHLSLTLPKTFFSHFLPLYKQIPLSALSSFCSNVTFK